MDWKSKKKAPISRRFLFMMRGALPPAASELERALRVEVFRSCCDRCCYRSIGYRLRRCYHFACIVLYHSDRRGLSYPSRGGRMSRSNSNYPLRGERMSQSNSNYPSRGERMSRSNSSYPSRGGRMSRSNLSYPSRGEPS